MAYTSAPETQTYSTTRVPAFYDIDFRPNTSASIAVRKDAGTINLLPRKYKNNADGKEEIYADTRYPILAKPVRTANGDMTRGMYVWEKTAGTVYYYVVVGTRVYTATSAAGPWTHVDTLLTTSNGPVNFTEFIDATNVKKLVMVDGVEGYVYTTNAAGTKIVDVDFPTPHVPYPVFIDGYLFLAKANTGDIYNSNLNDPALWTAGDFISSELYPDDVKALVKVNNYLLAVGTQGCEYFYDAANATASPLARYEGASLPFGTLLPSSIIANKNTVVMLANSNDGETSLKVIEDFKHKDIAPGWLIQYLNSAITSLAGDLSFIVALRSYFVRQAGQLYYCIRVPSAAATIDAGTFAYSFSTGMWTEFRQGNSAGGIPSGQFGVTCSFNSISNNFTTFIAGHDGNQTPFFGTFGPSTGTNYSFNTYAQDYLNGTDAASVYNIYSEIRTPILTFDTLNKKTMSRFGVELTNVLEATPVTIGVDWYDYDWSLTTGTGSGTIVAIASSEFPFLTQLGQFRQRAFRVSFRGYLPVVFKCFEMDINKGQQ